MCSVFTASAIELGRVTARSQMALPGQRDRRACPTGSDGKAEIASLIAPFCARRTAVAQIPSLVERGDTLR